MREASVHCLLDCLALALRKDTSYDPRPVYIGVWNAPFIADENGFSYYSETLDPDAELLQFERLYGKGLVRWQESEWSKDEKFARLEREAADEAPGRTIITLVDLFYMPYSAVCYRMKHLPHIVAVNRIDEATWRIRDPFFEWEGEVERLVLYEGLTCERLSAGITVHASLLSEPDDRRIAAMFREQFSLNPSPLVAGADAYLHHIEVGSSGYAVETLYATIGQVGVIAKRWNGFGRLASYFSDYGGGEAAETLELLDRLLLRWENFVLVVVRMGVLGNHARLPEAREKLAQIAALEYDVKRGLWELFERWEARRHASER